MEERTVFDNWVAGLRAFPARPVLAGDLMLLVEQVDGLDRKVTLLIEMVGEVRDHLTVRSMERPE